MVCIDKDPSKIKVMNNYCLVKFIDDDLEKSKVLFVVKRNYSTKIRSVHVGLLLDRPDIMYGNKDKTVQFKLDNLIKGKSIIAYDPRSEYVKVSWSNEIYYIIRVEDIYCILEDYKKEGLHYE